MEMCKPRLIENSPVSTDDNIRERVNAITQSGSTGGGYEVAVWLISHRQSF